jgi:seryl-tRNA synthetase
MASGHNLDSRVTEFISIDAEIKKLNVRLKDLRARKKDAASHIYKYMTVLNIEEYKDVKIKQVKPPPERKPRITAAEKKDNALLLFKEAGLPYPEEFWNKLNSTQK